MSGWPHRTENPSTEVTSATHNQDLSNLEIIYYAPHANILKNTRAQMTYRYQ